MFFYFWIGKTLKFSLTPDFDLTGNTFKCHIKHHDSVKPQTIRIEVGLHFTSMGVRNAAATSSNQAGSFHSNSYLIQFNTRLIHGHARHLLGDYLTVQFHDNIPNMMEAILVKQRGNSTSADEFFLKPIRDEIKADAKKRPIKVVRHREQKYVEFRVRQLKVKWSGIF